MTTDNKVTELVINEIAEETLKDLKDSGTVPPNQVFMTTGDSIPTGLPLGTIIPVSVVSDDACLRLLDGSSLLQTGVYSRFCTWLKNRVLANSNNVPTCTIVEYATEMTTYGQCGKFVINDTSSAQTSNGYRVEANSIKLPTITEFIASNNGGDAIGLAELDMFKSHSHIEKTTNANYAGNWVYNYEGNTGGTTGWLYQGTATYVNNAYDYVSTKDTGGGETKPKNIRYPYYIVVATSVKTDVEVDIDNVTNEINEINRILSKTEQVEVIYDMSDSSKDWGYSGGLSHVTVTGLDLSKYKKLIIYYRGNNNTVMTLDLVKKNWGGTYTSSNVFTRFYDGQYQSEEAYVAVNAEKTSFYTQVYIKGVNNYEYKVTNVFVGRIEGVF